MPNILPPGQVIWFSPRERQVLELVCRGRGHKEIAFRLELAVPTVKDIASRLYRKLELTDHRELIVWGVLHPEDVRMGRTWDPGLIRENAA